MVRAAKLQGLRLKGIRANFYKDCVTMSQRLSIRGIRDKRIMCKREMSNSLRVLSDY